MKQKETHFVPSAKMLKLLEAALNPDVAPNISAWCKAGGVSRVQWYRWAKDPDFLEWFNTEFRKQAEHVKSLLVSVGMRKALDGDFQFWKAMMLKYGELSTTNQPNNVTITISRYQAEKAIELAEEDV